MSTSPKKQMDIKAMFGKANGRAENGKDSPPVKPAKKGKGKLEDIYQKKTQLEHILLRPDTYIGSVEAVTEPMWVFDKETESIIQKEVSYVPGLYKIFDEILVNAADHKQRDPKMDTIKIEIDQETNTISIFNNGNGIPVAMHKSEKMFVPTMIFGHLLTSSNYDDEEQKVTGGRNGYGAKLCNIFSSKFTVETSCREYRKSFKQTWGANMSKASDAKVKESSGTDYTKITFSPDLTKFKMEALDDDIVSIMSRRAYDIAASSRGVKVFLNNVRVPVKNFKDYVDLFLKDKVDDAGNALKCAYDSFGERWEVAVTASEKGFQQVSFVNSIATTKGGRHVDYVTDMVVKKLTESLKKRNKSGVIIKPHQIKTHMWVFVNCLIVNPTFDSQTKETMTLQSKSFGSKCTLTDKFVTAISKSGIIEYVMSWAKFKEQSQLQSKCNKNKKSKITGIPKLEDANDAGSAKWSMSCTLILTEGDSAKTLAVAGLGVIGRDRYGVFPLKGKLLNVREATHKQILENAEINNVIKILGLQYKKKYLTPEDLKTLRYGKLMIMTDQDQDGSHIKGLLINFIHHNWPSLIQQDFIEEFITPIVKATKSKEEHSFYSLPEFEEWKSNKNNWHTYKIKYYKGLGTSTSKEAKEYFTDMVRHKIKFSYDGDKDDHAITMAFSKKAVDQRKEWLSTWMTDCKRRKELGLPDVYLYEKDTKEVNYTDFINKELIIFSNLDNERSLPCVVDGLKPGQRKVMFTCFKRNDKKEVKVAQLSGSVAEQSAYHHGEASLMSTIINLAHNFVGSNNINLLKPIGQFGTRLLGGKDAASPRYIFTQLSSLARYIFHPDDEPLLRYLTDDTQRIEPEWYMPVIPMILVNGADGIGTGWSTKIPNYDVRQIVANLKRLIDGKEPKPMIPSFKNFKGTIQPLEHQRYAIHGEISRLEGNQYEITELPLRTWTQPYKDNTLEALMTGTEKAPALLSDVRDYNTDTTVRMLLTVPEDKVGKVEADGPHKVFKLQTTIATSSMVCFDSKGCIKKYNDAVEILSDFFELRIVYYQKRKDYLEGMLGAEACKLSNQARFILEKCSGELTIENKKKKDMIAELQRKGFDSDPVKAWKQVIDRNAFLEEQTAEEEEETTDDIDYDYLLGMPMWNLTKEKKDEIIKKRDIKQQELDAIKKKTPKVLWINDLDALLEELEKVEHQEREDEKAAPKNKPSGGGSKKRKVMLNSSSLSLGERIIPLIDEELKKKIEKLGLAKEGKTKKVKKEAVAAVDEFDELLTNTQSLAARLGSSPGAVDKKVKRKKNSMGEGKSKKKSRMSFSDNESGGSGSDVEMADVQPRERTSGRRNAATNIKFEFDSDERSESDGDLSLHSNDGIEEAHMEQQHMSLNESEINEVKPKKKAEPKSVVISDTDSEFEATKPSAKKPEPSASDMFDSLVGTPKSPSPAKPKSRRIAVSDSDSDDLMEVVTKKPKAAPKPKKSPKPKAAPKKVTKKKAISDSEDDFFDGDDKSPVKVAPRGGGRGKKNVLYNFSESDSNSDF